MSNEIASLIISPVIGLIGVFVGARLSKNNEIKIRKEFLVSEMRIEKYQELSGRIHNYLRKIGSMHANIISFVKGNITHEEFKRNNDNLQEEALMIQREISIDKVFTKEFSADLDSFLNHYMVYINKIYDGFHAPDNTNPFYESHEVTREEIFHDLSICTDVGSKIIEKIENRIEAELKTLHE